MVQVHHYRLFGLGIASTIELPELVNGPEQPVDVTIDVGAIEGDAPPGPGEYRTRHGMLIDIEGVSRYDVRDGRTITVEPAADADDANVRLFLLGSAMGAILHQRELLPLHANAIDIDGRAIAFMGHSGAGKSTLAASFHDAGFAVLADDVVVVRAGPDGRHLASPGIPRVRLWEEAVVGSGRDPSDYRLSYAGDDEYRKFDVPLATVQPASLPLGAILILERGEEVSFERVIGAKAVEALVANTYRGGYVGLLGQGQSHWRQCLELAVNVPILRYVRPWSRERMRCDMKAILMQIRDSTEI